MENVEEELERVKRILERANRDLQALRRELWQRDDVLEDDRERARKLAQFRWLSWKNVQLLEREGYLELGPEGKYARLDNSCVANP
jgi:hypothetical protein